MSKATTIRLSAVESVQIEACRHDSGQSTVRLTLCVGIAPVLTKHLPAEVAGQLGDALADAVNALRWPA